MDTGCIDGVRIDITPAVALTAGCIEIGIASISGIGIMCKMERTVSLANRASEGEITFWSPELHVFEGTGMVFVPVARGVVCFVHHDNRIPCDRE